MTIWLNFMLLHQKCPLKYVSGHISRGEVCNIMSIWEVYWVGRDQAAAGQAGAPGRADGEAVQHHHGVQEHPGVIQQGHAGHSQVKVSLQVKELRADRGDWILGCKSRSRSKERTRFYHPHLSIIRRLFFYALVRTNIDVLYWRYPFIFNIFMEAKPSGNIESKYLWMLNTGFL